jgi:hypothetical protein
MGQTSELLRDVRISGEDLRLADVLRWAEKQDEDLTDAELLVSYLLHRAALDLVGRGGVVVKQRTNTWSRDGRNEDIEVTVGRPAPPSTGMDWTDCRSYWFYRRKDEIERAAEALALYRRYRKAENDLDTEQVEQAYADPRGGANVENRRFWIAYPSHVAAYGHTGDRISRAWGSGPTKEAALLAAIEPRAGR